MLGFKEIAGKLINPFFQNTGQEIFQPPIKDMRSACEALLKGCGTPITVSYRYFDLRHPIVEDGIRKDLWVFSSACPANIETVEWIGVQVIGEPERLVIFHHRAQILQFGIDGKELGSRRVLTEDVSRFHSRLSLLFSCQDLLENMHSGKILAVKNQ